MWIKTVMILCCVVATLAADDQHSNSRKKDPRGKRNLQYSISHHYNGPHAVRRISTGSQIPLYHSQFFPGPRSHSPYHQGRPRSLPAPPYAVQMEPLVHYSQRDPLYDTNSLSPNADGQDDLLSDNNHLNENVYGPQKHIVERPVYVKEPEPIIEIIIKEANVTLPPPPAPPTPPPKKKEEVQVFYVKYKKNPNGHGKESIIYEKPVPAISPPVEDEQAEAPPQSYHHEEVVTLPPPPSTTLRTIIRPDSETYHSPSGVKVTFGKEGFDYDKRSNKPEDLKASPDDKKSVHFPQGRQLSAFPPSNPRRPSTYSFTPPPGYRQPQPYRPFSQYRQQAATNFPRPSQQEYSTIPKFAQFPPQIPKNSPQFQSPRQPPPQFQRQPVAYQPFEAIRQPQPQFRPETHFPITQAPPVNQKPVPFNQFRDSRPQFNEPRPDSRPQFNEPRPDSRPQFNEPRPDSRPQFNEPRPDSRPQFNEPRPDSRPQFNEPRPQPQFPQKLQYQQNVQPQYQQQQPQPVSPPQFHQPEGPQFQQFQQRPSIPAAPQPQPPVQYQQQPYQQQQQLQQFNPQPPIIPPGGELIQSVPKYEQHISVPESTKPSFQSEFQNKQSEFHIQPQHQQSKQSFQPEFQNQQPDFHIRPQPQQSSIQINSNDYNEKKNQPQAQALQSANNDYKQKIEQQLREANAFQESIRQSSPTLYNFQQSPQFNFYQTTSKPVAYSTTVRSTTHASTTTTTEKPSTTTKDPKILNAQLPDEVPEDLRQQLLSSGILNHADISVLDYDKVGDIPLSALPPEQLSNFFSAGGAQQIQAAGSEPIPAIAERDFDEEASEISEVTVKPEVQMKVVRYDPESDRGQRVQESYVNDDAKQVDPVVLNDEKYNRYLPLKISGAQFPIPDVPELKGKKITSVVVLAPVAYNFSATRETREVKDEEIELLEGDALKVLLKNPTKANFEKFLEKENQTRSDKQAVILLVAGPSEAANDKEIFMYDISTKTVNKLDGELSNAFVNAAEANSSDTESSSSNIVETRVPYTPPVIDPQGDLESEGSENLESFVDISEDDLTTGETHEKNAISGISKTGGLS